MDVCPTQAIVAPYQVDARRCISYLTIELRDSIPVEFRRAIGNRIYGCDDCQLFCPWNNCQSRSEMDFTPRNKLGQQQLVNCSPGLKRILTYTEGSAIRRIGYECWLRNIAMALGNASSSAEVIQALQQRRNMNPRWCVNMYSGHCSTA
jgi:epoxyqueuosine reductase